MQEGDAHCCHRALEINRREATTHQDQKELHASVLQSSGKLGILPKNLMEIGTSRSELFIKHPRTFIDECSWDIRSQEEDGNISMSYSGNFFLTYAV